MNLGRNVGKYTVNDLCLLFKLEEVISKYGLSCCLRV